MACWAGGVKKLPDQGPYAAQQTKRKQLRQRRSSVLLLQSTGWRYYFLLFKCSALRTACLRAVKSIVDTFIAIGGRTAAHSQDGVCSN